MPVSTAAPARKRRKGLHDKAGHLTRRLNQNMISIFTDKMSGFDVSNVQFAALEAISDLEPTTQKEIADYIAMEPSNMHGVLRRLRERRLISIGVNRDDVRRNDVRLTKGGRDLLTTIRPLDDQVEPALLKPLSAPERAQFMELMRKLVYS